MTSISEIDYEVIVIGAGVCGIYQIKRLVDLGLRATVLEADADLGGTWYNNRYPGARFDSESYTYGYSFSREILDGWHWKELFSGQPENLRYLNFVAEKLDLRKHMQFNCRVLAANFDDERSIWRVKTSDDRELSCRFLIMGLGLLSIPTMPRIAGVEDFKGQSFHTFHWPHEGVDLAGKKVAVIGTGATGILPNPDVVHLYQVETGTEACAERVQLDVRLRENRTPDMLAMNPQGEIPWLITDGGFCISESIAICRYLDETEAATAGGMAGTPLLGTTAEERAETQMWLILLENKVLGPMERARHAAHAVEFYRETRPGQVHASLRAPSLEQMRAGFASLDARLAADGREYLCATGGSGAGGSRFSLADIRFYCLYRFFSNADGELRADSRLTHLHAYVDRVGGRPAAIRVFGPKPKL
jgi:glutathione S-transferase